MLKMNYRAVSLFLCLVFVFLVPGLAETKTELIQKYLREVIDHPSYDKRVPPDGKGGPGTPVDINVTMWFIDVSTLNEQKMDFEAQFYFRQMWVDPRLKYNIPGVQKIALTDVDNIWTPDLFFVNEKEGSRNHITQPNILVKIDPDGNVLYSTKVYEKLACMMDLHYFPHDTQKCLLTVESYGFTTDNVKLQWKPEGEPIGITESITSFNFDIIGVIHATNHETHLSGTYSTLEATLTFKRNAGFFAIRMYTPFAFLVILSWLSFWISAEDKCLRLVFLMVILYFMENITSGLDRWIPYTPYSKASDAWIGCCETLVFAAFVEFIFVAIYFKTEPRGDGSWGKIEMSSTIDNETEELDTRSNSFKSILNQVRRGGSGSHFTNSIDRISRLAFPIIFVLFNIIYWSVCGSA